MARLAIVDFSYPAGPHPELKIRLRMSYSRWVDSEFGCAAGAEILDELRLRFAEAGVELPNTVDLADLEHKRVPRWR